MHANERSEGQFLMDVRMRSARARRQINRIEDAVDALEETGRARGGHLRPGCSWSSLLQLEGAEGHRRRAASPPAREREALSGRGDAPVARARHKERRG